MNQIEEALATANKDDIRAFLDECRSHFACLADLNNQQLMSFILSHPPPAVGMSGLIRLQSSTGIIYIPSRFLTVYRGDTSPLMAQWHKTHHMAHLSDDVATFIRKMPAGEAIIINEPKKGHIEGAMANG